MILEEFDSDKNAVINPDMIVSKIEDFPDITVSCFSMHLFTKLLEFFEPQRIGESHSATGIVPIYKVKYKNETFAMYQSFVGEPACAGLYEDIIAMGSKCLILLGNCGVLDKGIEDCGIIIPIKAIRDEGLSYHYASPGDTIEVNTKYRGLFKEVLSDFNYSYVEGITWTNDACYRETKGKVSKRKEQGAICVEMECAGMQALCNFRNTDFFQFFYAGDNLDHSQWQPRSISGYVRLDDKSKIALLAFELGLKIKALNKQ
ncbi:MAG TPA: phosphorylase [Ruminococcaceae bacterium]|nr:phosphorylase [Oscillospiraceae bacterium]